MQQEKHLNGKDMFIGEYRETPAFASFKIFALASAIKIMMNNTLNKCYSSNDDLISAAVKLFADVINIHLFEDGNGQLC